MLRSPTVRDDGTGSAVLVKHATGAERARLRREAELLDIIRNEGVVTPVGFDEADDRCELRLAYLEAATLAEHPPLELPDVLDVLIAVGNTIADLHQQGFRHGALSRDHVLLVRPLRPVLCGFGDATGPADAQQHLPGTDLAGIAAIAEAELARTDRTVAGAAERRSCGDALIASRDLAAAAAEAPHDSTALHTWIARLGAIRHPANAVSFDAGLRGAHLAPDRPSPRWDRRRVAALASAAMLVIIAIVGWRVLSRGETSTQAASVLQPVGVPIGPDASGAGTSGASGPGAGGSGAGGSGAGTSGSGMSGAGGSGANGSGVGTSATGSFGAGTSGASGSGAGGSGAGGSGAGGSGAGGTGAGTLGPGSATPTDPDTGHDGSSSTPSATSSAGDFPRNGATLLYGTARPECPEDGTTGTGDSASDDCIEPQSAGPVGAANSGLLRLPSGQWSFVQGKSCGA